MTCEIAPSGHKCYATTLDGDKCKRNARVTRTRAERVPFIDLPLLRMFTKEVVYVEYYCKQHDPK